MSKYGRHHNEEERPLRKTTLFLYEGDLESLQLMHPGIGASRVIRLLIQKYIKQIRAQQNPEPIIEIGVDLPLEEGP